MRAHATRVLSALIPIIAALVLALPAQAALLWCKADPIVMLDGRQYQILVSVPEEYVPLVNGPIAVDFWVPESTSYELISTDAGFNGYGEVVTFTRADIENRYYVLIRVPIDDSQLLTSVAVPVLVEVFVDGGNQWTVEGTADGTIVTIPATSGTGDEGEED